MYVRYKDKILRNSLLNIYNVYMQQENSARLNMLHTPNFIDLTGYDLVDFRLNNLTLLRIFVRISTNSLLE